MVYIQLQNPYRFYDKLEITSVNFHENGKIVFGYRVCCETGALYDKLLSITEDAEVEKIKNASSTNLNSFDSICKGILEYVVSKDIEQGTIEVK